MFCPACGFSNPVPGVTCPKCGAVLPRARGATVVIEEDPTEAPPAVAPIAQVPVAHVSPNAAPPARTLADALPPQVVDPLASTAYDPRRAQGAVGSVARPVPVHGASPAAQPTPAQTAQPAAVPSWEPSPPDSRRGLVWRGIVGSFSMILGVPLVPFSILFALAVLPREGLERFDFVAFSIGMFIVGVAEIAAGVRVIQGGASPRATYVAALGIQFLVTMVALALTALELRDRSADALFTPIVVMSVPLLVPLARLIPLSLRSSGEVLGTRGPTAGKRKRAVPFVLWVPMVVLAACPVLVLAMLASALVAVVAWVDPPGRSYALAAALSGGALLLILTLGGVLASSVGLLRRSKWSVAVGGASGAIGSLLSLAVFCAMAYSMVAERGAAEMIVTALVVSSMLACLTVPCVALLAGAIKHGFRLPSALNVAIEPGAKRPGLLEVLVPSPGLRGGSANPG